MNPDKRRDEILVEFMELVTEGLRRLCNAMLENHEYEFESGKGRLRELTQQYHDDVIDPKRGEADEIEKLGEDHEATGE